MVSQKYILNLPLPLFEFFPEQIILRFVYIR